MVECYLCDAYIPHDADHHRFAPDGWLARGYACLRNGLASGARMLCHDCAEIEKRLRAETAKGRLWVVAGWTACSLAGWWLLGPDGSGIARFAGFLTLLGPPALAIRCCHTRGRRQRIARNLRIDRIHARITTPSDH